MIPNQQQSFSGKFLPITTNQLCAVCEQSAQVYVWSVSYPSSQPHSYGVTYLIGDGPISGGQDKVDQQTGSRTAHKKSGCAETVKSNEDRFQSFPQPQVVGPIPIEGASGFSKFVYNSIFMYNIIVELVMVVIIMPEKVVGGL